jgi:hypothetical protein
MVMSPYPGGNEAGDGEESAKRANEPPSAFRLVFPFLRIRGEIKAREL